VIAKAKVPYFLFPRKSLCPKKLSREIKKYGTFGDSDIFLPKTDQLTKKVAIITIKTALWLKT